MLKDNDTPLKPFVRPSSQASVELQRLGYAALAIATLAVSSLAPATVSAQQTESRHQSGHRVAVIDVGYIFRSLPAIKAHTSKVQEDRTKYKTELKQRQDTLKQAVAQLNTLKVGTEEYARQEEYVANLESKLRLERGHSHCETSDAEAKIYYDNYQRITAAVKEIASQRDIQLVLRVESKDMDSDQGDSVARGSMRNVVYNDSTINITDTVLRYLEQQTTTSSDATNGSAASATKPVTPRL